MSDIDSFKSIYSFPGVDISNSAFIDEPSNTATIKHLTVNIPGARLFVMNEKFSSKAGANFLKSSCCTDNADGVVIGELGNRKLLVVCELKSSYGNLQGGLTQIKSAYLKICQTMSICNDFNIMDYEIYFVLTVSDNAAFLSQMNAIGLLPVPKRKPIESLIYEMFQKGRVSETLNTVALPFAPHFHHAIVTRNVQLVLGMSKTDRVIVSI